MFRKNKVGNIVNSQIADFLLTMNYLYDRKNGTDDVPVLVDIQREFDKGIQYENVRATYKYTINGSYRGIIVVDFVINGDVFSVDVSFNDNKIVPTLYDNDIKKDLVNIVVNAYRQANDNVMTKKINIEDIFTS